MVEDSGERTTDRRAYSSTGRDEQKRESRLRIMECALDHFSRKGFDASSLRDIAADAGVTHALVRAHFGGKDELWRESVSLLFDRQKPGIDWSMFGPDFRLTAENVRQMIYGFVHYSAANPENIRIMYLESVGGLGERLRWLIDEHVERLVKPLYPLLESAMDDGIIVKMPLHRLIFVIASLSQSIFALKAEAEYRFDVDLSAPDEIDAHAETIAQLLLVPPRPVGS